MVLAESKLRSVSSTVIPKTMNMSICRAVNSASKSLSVSMKQRGCAKTLTCTSLAPHPRAEPEARPSPRLGGEFLLRNFI